MAEKKYSVFLKMASLEGYRSIQHVQINFLPGLNIIIGKNGSGKTNLLRFLYPFVNGVFDDEIRFAKGTTYLQGKKEYAISLAPVTDSLEKKQEEHLVFKLEIDNIPRNFIEGGEDVPNVDWFDIISEIEKTEKSVVISEFIQHGLPNGLGLWNVPMNSQIKLKTKGEIQTVERGRLLAFGMRGFTGNNFLRAFRSSFRNVAGSLSLASYEKIFRERALELSKDLANILKKYSPVSDVRLSPDTLFSSIEEANEVSIRNLSFEFYSENEWKSFDQLSDGIKRIVFILSELTNYSIQVDEILLSEIVFIEEPELGIHPHQLQKLMLFLKEEALTKQIVITTHSPQVLDILEKDELDRIIVCKYDIEKGTVLQHLTKEEKEKALLYMEEDFLSDYWRFSDLDK